MQLSVSYSSVRILPTTFSQYDNVIRFTPSKPTTKNMIKSFKFPSKCSTDKLVPPLGLYGESRFQKSLLHGKQRPNLIKAYVYEPNGFDPVLAKVSRFGFACHKFIRPYGIHHTTVAAITLFARVFVENPELFRWSLLLKAFPGLIAMPFANAYYMGINQIYDADIDRINKPFLSIPAGELSLKQAWFLVIFELIASLLIIKLMNADLITTSLFCMGLFCATAYSVPPFRFKRSSIATTLLLPTMGGILQNIGIPYATRASLRLPFCWSPPIIFFTTFTTLILLVITITKDLTDIEGDIKHNIPTFPAIFGARNMTFLCTGVLLLNYIGAIIAAIYMPQAFKSYLMLPVHTILALWLFFQARKLDRANYTKEASANFHQFLWKILNMEYLLFPFI